MIAIESLTEKSKERKVRYSTFGKIEYGYITSWNEKFIFVRYLLRVEDGKQTPRYGQTSEATSPEDLEFCL